MSTIWYTSDLHLGHPKVAAHRGFEDDIEQHDLEITEKWWSQVQVNDVVYVLGDIATDDTQYALETIKALPGTKRLIAGNHDPVHPAFRRTAVKWTPAFAEVFEVVVPFWQLRMQKTALLLSHFPYTAYGDGPHREPRPKYDQWRLPDLGLPLLHGHTHQPERVTGPNQLHVGWDAWGRLVNQEDVISWLKERNNA